MNTPISDLMCQKLQTIPSGSTVHRTYCRDTSSWQEEPFHADIAQEEKLLVESYRLLPGIEMSYNYFLAAHFSHQHPNMPAVMEVSHCVHGRMGWRMSQDLNLYLGEGDLSFHMKDACTKSVLSLPLGYYEGLSFSIDLQKLQQNPPDILKNAALDYEKIQAAFCDTRKIIALPQSFDIDCIFKGLYGLPTQLIIPYGQLKSQEFLLFFSQCPTLDTSSLNACDTEQVQIIKEIHTFLTSNLEERYTIDYLSKKYLMNTSTLKATFKSVYGTPIATYMKTYRMNQAISCLRETDYSMAEIANLLGYENQSKFTAAFKKVVGVLPTTYKKTYKRP